MAEGYEDIERLTTNQNQMLDNALQQQQDITNKQTAMNVAELERNKQEIDKDVDKTNKALYAEYRKATNPYGQNAENLASHGLANSGYAETTQTNLFNTYQRNVTDTLNNARDLKSDFDFQISKARQTGDITLAQNALAIYNQKMQLLTQEYELRNNREQFLYQKDQDKLAQSNWEKEYAMQQNQWQQTFDYQKQRDAVADSQWQQEFDLSKKVAASSGSRKSSSSKSSSSGNLQLNPTSPISDYAKSVANNLQVLKSGKGIIGKAGNAVVNQAKDQIAEMVNQGTLSTEEARYIFDKVGI